MCIRDRLYICNQKYNNMEVAIKKLTALRLNSDLLDTLKSAAKREHRSLNNYVECLLMYIRYNAVSYTHLYVYKRQRYESSGRM